jgi:selenocysteine-specific elongation factor
MRFALPAPRSLIETDPVSARNFILATAGHVDHGKSALVKALTGTDPDRLPDEKARGITIDLGFANLELPAPLSTLNPQLSTFSVGIVDVPGHEDFVKNMIAGVGSIDLALFVVATDDGWMPQTEEHLQILTYLGVEHAVIALTKIDLADATKTAGDVRQQLRGTRFEQAPIVETSTVSGHGLQELKQVLARELSLRAPQRDIGKPRLFVDRAFSLRGIGTVVTGTLTGGRLTRGQNVIVQPRNVSTRIRTIQSHNREQEEIGPGTRTALNVPDVEAGGVARGDVVTISELGEPVGTIDVFLTRSSRSPAKAHAIKNGSSAYFHHGTSWVSALVVLAGGKDLGPGDEAIAQLRLESPVFAFVGDRFVLRDPSERRTIAGGVVLDVQTSRAQFRETKQREFLAARAKSPEDPVVAVRSELRRDGAKAHVSLLLRSNFSSQEIAAAIDKLVAAKEIVIQGDVVADAGSWTTLRQRAAAAIESEHEKNPQLLGLDLANLRAELENVSSNIFAALVVDLGCNGYATIGNFIKRTEHQAILPSNLTAPAEKIRRLASEKPFDPPARKQIAPDAPARQALSFLIEQGEMIDLGPELILSAKAFSDMKAAVIAFISSKGSATVSEIRQTLQTSRRIVVPFLERLDRERVTRRTGDQRTLVDEIVARPHTTLD